MTSPPLTEFEVACRVNSETQLQVDENLNEITLKRFCEVEKS